MKKYISFFTLALLALTFSFSSCSDDDDNSGGNPEELSPDYKYSEQAVALLTVLDALAEVDSLPDNWNTSAFSVEATYGRALDAAKKQYIGQLCVAGDSHESRIIAAAKSLLYYGHVGSREETAKRITAITAQQLQDAAASIAPNRASTLTLQ